MQDVEKIAEGLIEAQRRALSPDMKLTATGSFNPQSKIVFNSGTRPTMTLHADGRITLSDDAQPTEAAAACIEAMSDMIQNMIKNAVSRQTAQSDALLTKLLKECLVKLRDVQGRKPPKEYACNLIKRIERVLQEQSK